jgi:hypothetical protein
MPVSLLSWCMGLLDEIGGILKQYQTGGTMPAAAEVATHFDQVSQSVPADTLADGVAHALRSDQTPALGQMVSTLFSQADGTQKAGMLNQLLSSLGAAKATPEQALQMTPDQVARLADQAHQADGSIVDKLSGFYAQHPTLVKGLGAGALALVMSRISHRT